MAPTTLSLCSGYGGLELAVRSVYPGSRVVGYVEWEAFSAAVLLARMEDKSLDAAPIWCGDLAELPAAPFLGVDLITAGFSCQPWSSAGKGLGTDDDRWIWPDIARLAERVGCRSLFLENVSPLIVRGGLALVLGDLATLGFDAEWTVLRASDVGAPHIRERVFILAHRNIGGREQRIGNDDGRQPDASGCGSESMANTSGPRRSEVTRSPSPDEGEYAGWPAVESDLADGDVEDVADHDGSGLQGIGRQPEHHGDARNDPDGRCCPKLAHGHGQGWEGQRCSKSDGRREPSPVRSVFPPGPDDSDGWANEPPGAQPSLRREADGSTYWLGTPHASIDDQLRTLGNGVVWQQAAAALRILTDRMNKSQAEQRKSLIMPSKDGA